jgi:hypothetical protein
MIALEVQGLDSTCWCLVQYVCCREAGKMGQIRFAKLKFEAVVIETQSRQPGLCGAKAP